MLSMDEIYNRWKGQLEQSGALVGRQDESYEEEREIWLQLARAHRAVADLYARLIVMRVRAGVGS